MPFTRRNLFIALLATLLLVALSLVVFGPSSTKQTVQSVERAATAMLNASE